MVDVLANDAIIETVVTDIADRNYAFDFRVDTQAYLYVSVISGTTETVLSESAGDFSITAGLGAENGGTMTLAAGIVTVVADTIRMKRLRTIKRETSFSNDFTAIALNDELDNLTMQQQELRRDTDERLGTDGGDATAWNAGSKRIGNVADGVDDNDAVNKSQMDTAIAAGGGGGGGSPAASETVAGIAEIATQTETDAGLDDLRIVTPLKLTTYPPIIANTAKVTYPSADAAKLAGIEAGADVTDTMNVISAGAAMVSVYDPTTVAADAFDMSNMVESAASKILTAAERAIFALFSIPALDTFKITVAGLSRFYANATGVGIGTDNPDGMLHVAGGVSGATAAGWANDVILENNAAFGMSFLVPGANSASIVFGSPSFPTDGFIAYRNVERELRFQATGTLVGNWSSTRLRSTVPLELPTHVKASLPVATTAGRVIFVSDDVGGSTMAFSDGTNWRRMSDRAVIS